MDFDSTHFLQYLRFFLKNCNFVKMHFYQNFEILNYFFLGLIISFWALVCKLVFKSVPFLVVFSRFSNFLYLQKMGISSHSFPKIVSANCFGLITHIIKLFQTVQIQKARLKIC